MSVEVASRKVLDSGLVWALVHQLDVAVAVRAFDPAVPSVLLLDHDPLYGAGSPGKVEVPLGAGSLRAPEVVDVAALRMTADLPLPRLHSLVAEMHPMQGLAGLQLERRPANVHDLDWHAETDKRAIAARYRGLGLVVAVLCPFGNEFTELLALSDEAMDAALSRIEATP